MNRIEFYLKLDKYKAEDKKAKEEAAKGEVIMHYGIPNMKWGQRRWQNADGTFNEEGKIRYFGKNGTTKKNKEEKIGSKKNLQDQKIGSGWGDKERSMLKDMSSSELREYYDVVKDMGRGTTDYHRILTDVNRELSSRGEDKVGSSKDQKVGATGIVDAIVIAKSVVDAVHNYGDVQDMRKNFTDFMNASDQEYSEDERLSVMNNKKKIAKLEYALATGDDALYNKTLKKVKDADKAAVEKIIKDINEKDSKAKVSDENQKILDEHIGSISKPKINKKYLNADGTLNDNYRNRMNTNRKASDVASSVFLALRNINLFEAASVGLGGLILSFTGFGIPVALAGALASGVIGGAAAIDNSLYKKLEKRADTYYELLN